MPPGLVAQSLGEWLRAWLTRIRSGDSGVLPVILALLIITVVFQAISPNHVFLSAGNLVNLFQQSAVFMVLAMGEIFVILLGEIDLSIAYAGGVGAAVTVQLVHPATTKWPWWAAFGTLAGVPWVIPIVLDVFGLWMVILQRTKFGRYVYAIGGNPEAARRAGINLAAVRTLCFMICTFTAGIGLLLYASYLGGMSCNINGGQLVLYAIASVVLAGTSLFGGRGKVIHGILGGLVIGGIYNGMGLLGLDVRWQFIVTGLVLLVAITIDSVSRRSATSGSAARV